jgi:hypothetical protein
MRMERWYLTCFTALAVCETLTNNPTNHISNRLL